MRKCRLISSALALGTVVWLGVSSAYQNAVADGNHPLANFDRRAVPTASTAAAARAAAVRLDEAAEVIRTRVRGVRVERNPITGTPGFIGSAQEFLSGPGGAGKAVTPAAVAKIPAGDPHREVKAFVNEHSGVFGHTAAALEPAFVKSDYRAGQSEIRTVIWEQRVDGIPVFEAQFTAHLTRRGELMNVGSHLVPDLKRAAGRVANRAAIQAAPPITAAQAVTLAAATLEEALQVAEVTPILQAPKGATKKQQFKAPRLNDASAQLIWLPRDADTLSLCWDVILVSKRLNSMYRVLIDAQTGTAEVRRCLTNDISDATYRVFTGDSPSPFSPGHPTPSAVQPPVVARSLVTLQALNTTASPSGWIDDGVNETRGNNVDAHLDLNADDVADTPRPQGSPSRVFDFPLDLATSPANYRNAAVTQLFYTCNWIHDKLYELGFTEAAGNFQLNNFGRGGADNDAIEADAQDGSGTNNANFSTPPDGAPGRMQMYIFTGPNPDIDGDLDSEIIIHEYVHGLSNRLVGNGVGISQLQTAGMGEGWSDFYGLALLSEPGDNLAANYPMGGYATYQFSGLAQNYYYGIRRYPYSTDMARNPLTFKDIDPSQASPHTGIPRNPAIAPTADEVHNIGEVWCVTLWDARANLIQKHGFATGNQLILQLVTDGMKLAPANPNFLQARDAILQADLAATGGANANELWAAFAKRGMGASAGSPASSGTAGLVEACDFPDDMTVSPLTGFTSRGIITGPFAPSSTTYTVTNVGASSLAWTVSNTQPWLTLSSPGGTLAPGASATVTATLSANAGMQPVGARLDTIIFTNVASTMTRTRAARLEVEPVTVPVFSDGFESGALSPASWTSTGTSTFRTLVTTANAPRSGSYHLTMDSSSDGTYARNEATLTLDLTGRQNVFLKFWAKMFSDEPDGPPSSPFTTGANFDGVAISLDGITWYEARGLRDLGDSYGQYSIDLDAAIASHGWAYNSAFKIRFNHYDNFAISIDGFAFDDVTVVAAPVDHFTIALPATTTEGAGTLAGTISTPSAQASDLIVNLASSDTSGLIAPATVTIPAGQSSAPFVVTVVDDSEFDGTQVAVILATAAGFPPATAQVSVDDNESATLSLTLPAGVSESAGTVQGTVALSAIPSSNVIVALSSSDTKALVVPPSVTILAGQTSRTFTITVIDDAKIDGTQQTVITAHVPNWNDATATVAVTDSENMTLALTLPSQVTEGTPGMGTIALSGTLPAHLTVTLQSDNPAQITVPASVSIPAGQSAASFSVTAVNDTVPDGTQTATITAAAGGFTSATGMVSAIDNEIDHFIVSPIGTTQIRNVPFSVTITAKNVNDITITNFTGPASLGAAGAGGQVSVSPASTSSFTSGAWTGNVTATSFDTNVVLTVASAGNTGSSNPFNVTFGAPHHFSWSPIGASQHVNIPFNATITALDAANNTVPSFSGPAVLSCGPPMRSVGTGTTPWNQPMYTYYDDSRTQSIYLASELGAAGTIAALSLNVTTLPGQTLNNWTIRMKHTSLASYGTAAWESTGWTTVFQNHQTVSETGWVKFIFSAPFNYDGVSNLLVDFSYNNNSWSSAGACRASTTATNRSIHFSSDSTDGDPLTWAGTSNPPPVTSTLLPNIQLTMARTGPMNPVTTGSFVNGIWSGGITLQQTGANINLLADGGGITGESNSFTVTDAAILTVTPGVGFSSGGVLGGPFVPPAKVYAIGNTGTSPMNWTAASPAGWMTLSPTVGTLAAGASTNVAATIHPNANNLEPGTYTATITFANASGGAGTTTRAVSLTVTVPVPALAALPPVTGGTTTTVSWGFLPGADLYEVQHDSTPAFSNPGSSGQIRGTSHTVSGLGDGARHYRARARRLLATATTAWTQTSREDFASGFANNVSITASPGDAVLAPVTLTWTENFDQPGSAWSATIFNDGTFIRDPLSPGATIPDTTPPLPVNRGGENEAQGDNSSVLMAAVPANVFEEGSIDAYLVPASAPASAYTGLLLGASRSGIQVTGHGAIIGNATSSSSLSVYRFNNGVANLIGATVPFTKAAANENLRMRFSASGTTLTASLWRVSINAGAIVEIPVPLEGGTNSIVRPDSAYAAGVAGLFSQVTSPINKSLYDDVKVTASAGFVPSGSITTGPIAPSPLARWGQLAFTADVSGAGTALTVDVLDAYGALLAADVASGAQLDLIATVAAQPSIRLRANLSTSAPTNTPKLRDWTVTYHPDAADAVDGDWSLPVSSTQDVTLPSLTASPADYTATDQASISLLGTASDASGILSVTVNGVGASTGDGFAQWSSFIPELPVGLSTFTITAQDHAVPPNTTTTVRRVLRFTPTSYICTDGLTDRWKLEHGLDPFDITGVNAASGDPDKDGIPNLLERALNLHPQRSDTSGLPSVSIQTNSADGLRYLMLTYRRLTDSTGLIYIIETSTDLQNWAGAGSDEIEEISNAPTGDGLTTSKVTRIKPALNTPGLTGKFVRLRVAAQ